LTELRISDLRFTPSEAAEFLNHVMDLNLSADNIAILEASTEGWVAGLQLAALSMQGRDDIPGFIKAFSGDDRHVVDYLVEEVLNSQSEEVRSFLLQTSILDRLNGPLCDAITNQQESKGLLEDLERGNLFVVPLDDKRQWYRYHHLFAEVLHTRLMEKHPDLAATLHRRASEWYEQNGLPVNAVHHALEAEDFVQAAGLLELAWPAMNESCQAVTWLGWAKALPEELFRARPVLIVGYAWALLQSGEMELPEVLLHEAEQWLTSKANNSGQADAPSNEMIVVDKEQFRALPASIANAHAYRAQALGDVPGTLKYTRQALDLLTDGDYLERAIPAALIRFVHWGNGDLESAHQSFSDIMTSFQMSGDISGAISLATIKADIRMAQGLLNEAANTYEKSVQLATNQGEPVPMGIEDIYRGKCMLHIERGDLEAAMKCLQRGEELSKQTKASDWQYRLSLTRAQLKENQGDWDSAHELFDKAQGMYVRSPVPDLYPIAAMKTRVWIRQGNLKEARNWAREQKLSFDDDLSYLHEFEHITLARLLIAQNRSQREDQTIHEAMGLLDRLLEAAEKGGRLGSVIEILVLQALSLEVKGKLTPALKPLERAMSKAEPEGFVRIFVDEGRPMAQLLTELTASGKMTNYARKLLDVFDTVKKE